MLGQRGVGVEDQTSGVGGRCDWEGYRGGVMGVYIREVVYSREGVIGRCRVVRSPGVWAWRVRLAVWMGGVMGKVSVEV